MAECRTRPAIFAVQTSHVSDYRDLLIVRLSCLVGCCIIVGPCLSSLVITLQLLYLGTLVAYSFCNLGFAILHLPEFGEMLNGRFEGTGDVHLTSHRDQVLYEAVYRLHQWPQDTRLVAGLEVSVTGDGVTIFHKDSRSRSRPYTQCVSVCRAT